MKNILFLCTGNICRSPMAEAHLQSLVTDMPDFSVRSAGIAATHGQPASQETQEVLGARDIPFDNFQSQRIDTGLASWATHIFTMTGNHLAALEMLVPEAIDKAYLVTEFCQDDALRNSDVPDPIGLGTPAYEETFELLQAALPDLLKFIQQTTPPTE